MGSSHHLAVLSSSLPETICILPNRGLERTKFPIFLGVQGGSRCLACVETGEGPSLQLEVSNHTLYWGPLQTSRVLWHLCAHLWSSKVHTSLLFGFPPSPSASSAQTLPSRTCRGNFPGERLTFWFPHWPSPRSLEG